MTLLLEKGHNIEVFIEGERSFGSSANNRRLTLSISPIRCSGTRSRSGKLLPPKFGVLKTMLDAVLSGRTSDVLLCPVSIQVRARPLARPSLC